MDGTMEAIYLGELTIIVITLFAAGFFLLGSKRPKDQKWRWFGWVFYGLAFIGIGAMFVLLNAFI